MTPESASRLDDALNALSPTARKQILELGTLASCGSHRVHSYTETGDTAHISLRKGDERNYIGSELKLVLVGGSWKVAD
jgi:hypothetical protein